MGVAEYKELRTLTMQAVGAVGERRTALIAGCSLSSVQTWLRRPQAHIMRKSIDGCLPRLRRWRQWVPGREAAMAEAEVIQAGAPTLEALMAEFDARLSEAADRCTVTQIAYGCEVSVCQIQRWGAGVVPEYERGEIIRAVGHLRYVTLWPDSPTHTQAPLTVAAVSVDTPPLNTFRRQGGDAFHLDHR